MIRGKLIVHKHYTSRPPPHGESPSGLETRRLLPGPAVLGVWVLLGSITMMFIALAIAMISRRGLTDDWLAVPWPRLLWLNTGLLALSSAAIFAAPRLPRHFPQLWRLGAMLGLFFLTGQYLAWRQVYASGIGFASNPGASFFYLFTIAHALHVVGGVAALVWVALRLHHSRVGARVQAVSLYWHFLTLLWLGLIGLFLYWGRS